ncbi:hypothetical protein [Mucilaginibacter gynuensis]
MKPLKIFILGIFAVLTFYSCKKDYVIGGSLFEAKVNMSTYDYLKTNHKFDTLLIMIDKMNLKDDVNKSGTFFAFTNYSIHAYVNLVQNQKRVQGDENLVFTFDSLELTPQSPLRDSLKAYMFKDRIAYDNLDVKGKYVAANDGEKRLIQLRPTTDYTSGVFTTLPKYIFFTKLVLTEDGKPLPNDIDGVAALNDDQFLSTLCQTTGIITTTGTLHVLSDNHTFTYFGDKNN